MKSAVYILELCNGQYYIGSTPNLERRLNEHRLGKAMSTKGKLPFKLVFSQGFVQLQEARNMEYKLKKYKNKNIIKQIVADGFIKSSGC
ncbi:hypothetical protein COT78_03405 [Candidatus Berkelbacteria bacterium CG10_big_fil_rev_8_21_14_0_10_43_13]|uniref:GIY-YIG domain-containing protein n=1 Tax=Candidatus Berkelbacteria bacterium CG10_big_fil_rev_8_21_14_0_10_43_13 TaxID=1974514 RepID=A0A2H0W5Z5_9BACT|nr:MAG: hypothetical protein COT78_03405 [Candidatus Berkelbacteria bacterium CG10_big_fil_rev_8_21_14_0_10_43_13]